MDATVRLEELLQDESAWVEWKDAGDRLAVVRTLVAFANDESDSGRGGYVLCGVEEIKDADGSVRPNVVGLSQGERTGLKQKVLESCANDVSPPLTVAVYEEALPDDAGRAVVIFFVAASAHVHEHQTEKGSKVWGRRDSSTREIKREALRQLRLRKGEIPSYLEQPAYNRALGTYASLDDIDMVVAGEFRKWANLPRPMADYFVPNEKIDASAPALCMTHSIGPGRTGVVPTNLAVLLFGYEPTRFIRGAFAEVAIFPGTDIRGPIALKEAHAGPLVQVIREVLSNLRGQMGMLIDKRLSSFESIQNRMRYSEKAVQEAIMNAFAHRDYENAEHVRIMAFSDRIEVASPGGVISGIDASKIVKGEVVGARWRNAGLSRFLARMSLGVQAMGQGVPTIFEETKITAERLPEYEIDATQVKVTIPAYHPDLVVPAAVPSPTPTGKDVLILVSIGSPSIRAGVELSRKRLGLENADVAVDFSLVGYVDPARGGFERYGKAIRNEIAAISENPTIGRLHLFYRGPVVFAPLFGALAVNKKSLVVYYYDEKGEYHEAYTLNTKFLKSRD